MMSGGACALSLLAWVSTLAVGANPVSVEHRQRYETADVDKLAALTRSDHSTIFFTGRTKSGYVRDGEFHPVVLAEPKYSPTAVACRGRTVSRDGSRIAYVVSTDDHRRCRILVRDLKKDLDTQLVEVDESPAQIAWSWDDAEIAYQRRDSVIAVSTRSGRGRPLVRLPLRVAGRTPVGPGMLTSLDWFHQRVEILANAEICVPTRNPGECQQTGHVLMLGQEDSRILALGLGGSVSPLRDEVAFVTSTNAQVVNADGSNGRRITEVPYTLLSIPPFLHEKTWWSEVEWSPNGDRFLFGTTLDEEFNSNYYLVDVRSGTRRRILNDTSLDIVDWR